MSTFTSWTPRTSDSFSISIPSLIRAQREAEKCAERQQEAQQCGEFSPRHGISTYIPVEKPASLKR